MLRYTSAALALKAFSATKTTKKIYRALGNTLGKKRRMRVKTRRLNGYIARGNLFKSLCEKHLEHTPESRFLEIGTGWFHWYAIYFSLFHPVHTTLFDIWDNRQFEVLQIYLQKLRDRLSPDKNNAADVLAKIDNILAVKNFTELYSMLQMQYIIEPNGSLAGFAANSFDCVYSFHVMEHVKTYETSLQEFYRILKPGGISVHQIGIDDHHTHYDKKQSMKNYMQIPELTWKLFFENEVQYINRLQMSDWMKLFKNNGFELLEKIPEKHDVWPLILQPRFQHYSKEDVECTILTIVHRKPIVAGNALNKPNSNEVK